MTLPYDAGNCLTCGRQIDDKRAVRTNYLFDEAGKPGGPQDWYACGGCLTVFRITWEAIKSLGDDGWAMFPADEILVTGAAVAHVIERLRERIAAGEPARALEELNAAPEGWRLVEHPEVVAAAWPAFGGRAITTTHLTFHVTTVSYAHPVGGEWRVGYPVVALHDGAPEVVERLLREPYADGIRKPKREGLGVNSSALMTGGTRVVVVGSGGPFVHVLPAKPLWENSGTLEHFQVLLERIALDPDAP